MIIPADEVRWARTTSVLAIDPGAKTGWALFTEPGGWRLAGCGVVRPTDTGWEFKADLVVIENPVIYPHSKARPKDILTLARVVGRYQERFATRAKRVELVEPREWKGTVDGDVMTRRIDAGLCDADRRVKDACLADVAPSYRHNGIDAIGLGKWVLRQRRLMLTPGQASALP